MATYMQVRILYTRVHDTWLQTFFVYMYIIPLHTVNCYTPHVHTTEPCLLTHVKSMKYMSNSLKSVLGNLPQFSQFHGCFLNSCFAVFFDHS